MKLTSLLKIGTGLSLIALIFGQCTSGSDKLHQQFKTEVDALNKQFPQTVSTTLRIDSCVLLKNNDMQYYYTYTDTAAFDTLQFEDEIVASAKELTKTDPGMADIRDNEITNEYIYRNLDGVTIYRFKITPQDYK